MESLAHPHWEALTSATQEAFRLLSRLELIKRFYLAGGTGLALHFGHRFSVDLDFFSADEDSVGPDERSALRSLLDDPTLDITYDKDSTFVAAWRGVGISFFRLNLYPLVKPTLLLDNIRIASIEEIGAMKLAAIIDRGTRKDLVDLYFILQQISLDSLFQVAAVKYAKVRTFPISATRALAYFDDAESLPMLQMMNKTPWSKMKKFLETKAVEAGRKRLEDLWE
ncbi:MAG: nucleotidyl transferase AbiEii/AbiGii toxin family protein [Anaerolineae bacterium]|nr:nucleotidyl transferase AbiEii/AbiGii toxin family protein [Anaerolineae bacterium]MCI0608394.1 nucleotidyl transferase AbiEii/AbiGii toxin family protein [Anaerolineae bacterium]